MYLFVWSDILWPRVAAQIPVYQQVYGDSPTFIDDEGVERDTPRFTEFKRERAAIVAMYKDLGLVRRALANIATYMIFDDHEVTDDFYLNRDWIQTSLLDNNRPLSRRLVLDGLLAYMALSTASRSRPSVWSRPGCPTGPRASPSSS